MASNDAVQTKIALYGCHMAPGTLARPRSVTSDDITFSGTVSEKSEHDTLRVISSATTLSVVFIALDEACDL